MSEEIKNTEEEVKEEQTVEETKTEEPVTEESTESEKDEKEDEKESKKSDKKKEEKKSDKKDDDIEPKKDKSKGLLGVVIALTIVLIGMCVYIGTTSSKNSKATTETSVAVNKSVLTDALNELKKKDSFIVTTYVNAPMGNTSYIEYVTPDTSATLVDDNYIETPFQQIDLTTVNYRYNDLIKDGHMYMFYDNVDTEGKTITEVYQAPDEYAKECSARSYMFFDLMKDDIKDLEFVETAYDTDLGNGPVAMDVYKGKLDSKIVKKIMGNGTISLYESVKKNSQNEGMQKLMGWLIDDIDFTMQYSDANVIVGISDGMLIYVNLEIGGLGTKMYVTKCYIENTDVATKLAVPSIANAVPYEELYANYAEMALNYDSMEGLYNAVYSQNNPTFTEEELQEMLDNAVKETEEKSGKDIETEVILDDGTGNTTSNNTTNTTEQTTEKLTTESTEGSATESTEK